MADVAIVLVSWNTRQLLADSLQSIADTTGGLDVETVVVDNGSGDGSAAMVRERFPAVRLIANDQNRGFAGGVNQGVAASGAGRFALLLNSDARLLPGTLAALLALAESQPRAAVVGARVLNADGSFQASHASFPHLAQQLLVLSGLGRLLIGDHYPSHGPQDQRGPQAVDWVSGACLLVRRAAFDAVGGLDTGFFMYAEETDLCYRLHAAGWQVWYQPAARVVHHGRSSHAGDRAEFETNLYRSQVRFVRKHRGEPAARRLMRMICLFTAVKVATHGVLRRLSRGHLGRPVVSLHRLRAELDRA